MWFFVWESVFRPLKVWLYSKEIIRALKSSKYSSILLMHGNELALALQAPLLKWRLTHWHTQKLGKARRPARMDLDWSQDTIRCVYHQRCQTMICISSELWSIRHAHLIHLDCIKIIKCDEIGRNKGFTFIEEHCRVWWLNLWRGHRPLK